MRIGIDARLWNETGVGRYIRNLIKNLQVIDRNNSYVLFVKSEYVESIRYQVLSNKFKIIGTDIHWHSVKEQLFFHKIIEKENLDLMHFTYFSLPIFYQRPFIVTIHDLIINHFPTGKASTLPSPVYNFKRLAYKIILRRAIERAKKIIVPLNATKKDLIVSLKANPDKVVVTYEGVDDSIANPESQIPNRELELKYNIKNKKFFLYVGNAYPHKNIQILIKVFNKLANREIKLILIGKEDYFYKQLAVKLKDRISNNIQIIHNVTDSELHELYKKTLAVIAPSLMEGFGLVPLEAMANKCLVLVSDIPSHREVCGDSAIYFHPDNSEDLHNKLLDVLENVNTLIYKNKLKLGIERIKLFSWGKMAAETLKIYEYFEK